MQWDLHNIEWIFSGIGVFIIATFIALFKKAKNKSGQHQTGGDHSTNIQSGRDIRFKGR